LSTFAAPAGPAPANPAPEAKSQALKFSRSDRFVKELRSRVDAFMEQTGRKKRDVPSMYLKTATLLTAFFSIYITLMFFVTSWWLIVPLAMLLGVTVAGIGFNIQHDGGHRAYSERPWVNKLMSLTLDLMGGSSYMWDWKHNSLHHTYPNIDGHDDDINVGILGRLSPHQPRYSFHRLQGIYLWFLYGFLAVKWHLVDDFVQVAKGRIGEHKIPRPRGKDLAVFVGGKVVFFSMAFGLPLLLHPWWGALGTYLIAACTSGIVLSVVFQLAHCVEEASFPQPVQLPDGGERMETEWAVHQVQTTVNFARESKFLSWFLGGLNYQIEHHLFSRICHVHYPAISKVVEETCNEFGIRYAAHKTMWSAIGSHFRWLVRMGWPESKSPQQ